MAEEEYTGFEIAVIGMAGRFPGARTLDEFWENLISGVESIYFLSDEEIEKNAIDSKMLENPGYVKAAGGMLEDKEFFDAAFFGYTPAEATLMDPQLRLFHECALEVLENAGYDPDEYNGLIGLYISASPNYYWKTLAVLSGKAGALGDFASRFLTESDFISTKVSHKLNLRGPAANIGTACSSSLVSIHMASRSLLTGECDMVIAGGISVWGMSSTGYIYQEDMINSKDGHCRAFDARARGTIGGEGVGIVMLKSLEEALEHGDYIYAVIKSSAINNDGTRKVGYTAPSIEGQAEVIRTVLRIANINPETVTYIETHGTGTELGDPVEIAALELAFNTDKKGFCALGAVKTNIGHLDYAAGAAGLIKTILALKHRIIPPSLHYQEPNPEIDFAHSPFYVNTRAVVWENKNHPLRAGVSSFGIGGTNAHMILEEAPAIGHSSLVIGENKEEGKYRLILLSAKTKTALDKMTYNLAEYFKKHPTINLDDAAFTLSRGRKSFPYRRITTAADIDEAIENLSYPDSRKVYTSHAVEENRQVIFMFPGLGSEYVNMGLELYQKEPVFREETDRCFEILKPLMDYDIKKILYPHPGCRGESPDPPIPVNSPLDRKDPQGGMPDIHQPEIAQLAIFIFEYALAGLLMHWGIKPHALIGYSFGEYTAACLSGVFSPKEALTSIVKRGKLLQSAPVGGMLSIPLPVEAVKPLIDPRLDIAIDNGPSCVIAGPIEPIAAFEKEMKKQRYLCTRLKASRALHSRMMAPLTPSYRTMMNQVKLSPPRIPYISNVTGTWITGEEAVNPGYWVNHLQGTVRFADGIGELLKKKHPVFLEIGPGSDLGALVRHHPGNETHYFIINTIKHPQDNIPDCLYLLKRLGRLWLTGIPVDWDACSNHKQRHRIPLPTYPFDGKPFWIEGNPFRMSAGPEASRPGKRKKPGIADWFYYPSWKRSQPPPPGRRENLPGSCWLLLIDDGGLGSRLAQRLKQEGQEVILVKSARVFARQSHHEYMISPGSSQDYDQLLQELQIMGKKPQNILHLWCLSGPAAGGQAPDQPPVHTLDREVVEKTLDMGFYSLIYMAQALGKRYFNIPIKMTVLTDHMHRVTGREILYPEKATIIGAVKVIPQEYANIDCTGIDIDPPREMDGYDERLVRRLMQELPGEGAGSIAAYRGLHRWEPTYEPIRLEKRGDAPANPTAPLKEKGVYLITGGLGGIGFELAKHLAHQVQARLILTGRSDIPDRKEWDSWLQTHEEDESTSRKINKIREIEGLGAEVMVFNADTADPRLMAQVVALVRQEWGPINGVIHSAGVPDGCTIHLRTKEATDKVLLPKVMGTVVLDRVLKDTPLDFFIMCSSLTSITAMFGLVGYCAANAFQDAFAHWKNSSSDVLTTAIDWDTWKEVGMGVEIAAQLAKAPHTGIPEVFLDNGILNSEGVEIFNRILQYPLPQVVVSTTDLTVKLKEQTSANLSGVAREFQLEAYTGTLQPRPALSMEYVAPGTEFEKTFANLLKQFFGYDQVGIDDNLFEFGVTSLSLIRINNLLKEKLKKDIPIVLMFEYPTIGSLGRYLEQEEKGEPGIDDEVWELQEREKEEELLQQSMDLFNP